MLHFDLEELLEQKLAADRRPPDGLLHPSGDLIGSLRHAQLRAAGAPTVASEVVSDIRLMTGTMWHTFFESVFRVNKLPVMTEVKLDRWLPEGWSGTADWLMWSDEYRAFVLGDLKTAKGEGMSFVERDGIKDEHLWQLSAYWYAVEAMGLPLVKAFNVLYLPMNATSDSKVTPLLAEGRPLPREEVMFQMTERWRLTKAYLKQVSHDGHTMLNRAGAEWHGQSFPLNAYLNDLLAPEQERVQILRWNGKQKVYDVKLAPHWSTAYCPYPNELCACSEQGTNKIGSFQYLHHPEGDQVVYCPRAEDEFKDIKPTVTPPSLKTFKEKLSG